VCFQQHRGDDWQFAFPFFLAHHPGVHPVLSIFAYLLGQPQRAVLVHAVSAIHRPHGPRPAEGLVGPALFGVL